MLRLVHNIILFCEYRCKKGKTVCKYKPNSGWLTAGDRQQSTHDPERRWKWMDGHYHNGNLNENEIQKRWVTAAIWSTNRAQTECLLFTLALSYEGLKARLYWHKQPNGISLQSKRLALHNRVRSSMMWAELSVLLCREDQLIFIYLFFFFEGTW